MKVSIGTNIKEGPWGGGNLFAVNLKKYLEGKGHTVINNLADDDIDLILITEPRKTSESSAYTHVDVLDYLSYVNRETLVVHRFNECDERKKTNYVNKYLMNANKIADHTIFVSKWLKNLYEKQGLNRSNVSVIYAGADKNIFNNKNFQPWTQGELIKVVTHHWGSNWNKGFEIYLLLDELIGLPKWKNKISFTYIGNIPKNLEFKNTTVIKPLSGNKLAAEIKKNNLYLTGSLNEPSGNHHIEAGQCGLPILYVNSGGIPEYCNNFGTMFNNAADFEMKLLESIEAYPKTLLRMKEYPYSSDLMCNEYLELFEKMIKQKVEYIKNRRLVYNKSLFRRLYFNKTRKRKSISNL